MKIAWTTVGNRADAEQLATGAVKAGLAVCAQVDGPIVSFYRWQGKIERSEEFRLCFKCLIRQLPALEKHLIAHHPYDTPEWIVVATDQVGEKYLSWAEATSSPSPL